jgi:hypothetical protein
MHCTGSPAIDAGNPDPATCPVTDVRGMTRPQDGDGDSTGEADAKMDFINMIKSIVYICFLQKYGQARKTG